MAKLWQTLNSRKVQQVFEPFGRGWHKIDFSFILYGLATSSAFRTLCLKKRAKIFEKLYLLRFSNKSMSWIFLGSGLHSPSWKRYSLGVPTLVDDCQANCNVIYKGRGGNHVARTTKRIDTEVSWAAGVCWVSITTGTGWCLAPVLL